MTSDSESLLWSSLPLDLVVEIFKYFDFADLANCSQVSKLFYSFAHQSELFSHLDLTIYSHVLTSQKLKFLLKLAGSSLRVLDVTACDLLTDEAFQLFSTKEVPILFTSLQHLTLAHLVQLNSPCLASFLYHGQCYSLQTIDLSGSYSLITDAVLYIIGYYCRHVHSIKIRMGYDITNQGISYILQGCPLRQLVLETCPRLNASVWELATMESMDHPDTLEYHQDYPPLVTQEYHHQDYLPLLPKTLFPTLTHVNVAYCRQISDDFLYALSLSCPRLISLNISHCSLVSNVGMFHLVPLVLGPMATLSELDMSGCYMMGDEGIYTLVGYTQGVDRCLSPACRLEKINMSGCAFITDDGLEALFECALLLQSAELASCSGISRRAIHSILEKCKCIKRGDTLVKGI